MPKREAAAPNISEAYLAEKPVDLAEFREVRTRTLSAIRDSSNSHAAPNDSLIALVGAWEQAPQGAVIAIELAKAAARAGDERRLQRFVAIAKPLVMGRPNLAKALEKLARQGGIESAARTAENPHAMVGPVRRLEGVEALDSVCGWIRKSFAEGRPPVKDVGPQGTNVIECQTLPQYDLSPDIQALPVVAAARGHGQRFFGWIAARWRSSIWLSPTIAESFAPPWHPNGNGFSIELQRAQVFRDGVPELSAYITERKTAIDPALNEMHVTEQQEIVLITFDLDPPEGSSRVLLHSKITSGLVDPSDAILPRGYSHSANLGKASEIEYRLSWGNNRAVLVPAEPKTKPVEQTLFAE